MKKENKPPKTKGRNRPAEAETTAGKQPQDVEEKRTSPEASQQEKDSGNPSQEEVISTWRKPITNQDEQEKITDDGGGDIPIQDS